MYGIEDGDIFVNRAFGDLWMAKGDEFIRINDSEYKVEIENIVGFVKVGHIDMTRGEK